MPTPTLYSFVQQVDYSTALSQEISGSPILIALDHIETVGSGPEMDVSVWFKDVLSEDDETTLNSLMAAYTNPQAPVPSNVVTTQFELRNKTIKLASVSGAVQEDGTVAVYLKVPGTPNPSGLDTLEGRWISSGVAFFDIPTPGDRVTSVRFVDHDNILGYGEDFVVGSYTDDEADIENQGWFLPPKKGEIIAEAIGGYGFAPSGFYIMITAKKGNSITTGTFYINIEWGKTEF